MKKQILVLCTLCLGQVALISAEAAAPQRRQVPVDEKKPLKIVFDNDVHGSIDRYEYLAGYRDALKEAGYPVLTVSVGDYLQGSAYAAMSQGQFCVNMMNAVGYDVVAIGNHDVDYGVKHLLNMRDSLKNTAMVCVNLMDENYKNCLPGFTICNVGGYRVAFIGVLTTATEQLEAYVTFDKEGNRLCSFSKDSLVEKVQKVIDIVRNGKPDWVVLLTHMGVDPLGEHMASWQLLEQLEGVDVVIDGHSHSVVNTVVMSKDKDQGVVVAQTGSGLNNVGCVTLTRGEAPRVKLYSYQNLPQNAQVHEAYEQVVEQMKPILGQVVGYTPFELCYRVNGLRAVRKQETNLGDLVADAYRETLKTDIGWVNGGGIRTGILTGDITYGQILSVSPFNNFMCVAQVTGRQLEDALEEVYHNCPNELGSFAQISGLRCQIDTTIQNVLMWNDQNELTVKGQRRVCKIEVMKNGEWQKLNKEATYTIASTNYVVYEGESRGLKNAIILKDKIMTDTDCLQNYIMSTLGGTIPNQYIQPQDRVKIRKVNL